MPLEIRPVESVDVPTLLSLAGDALNTGPLYRLLHKYPPHAAYIAQQEAITREKLAKPHICFVKVVDTEKNDEIIAAAMWEFYENGRSDAELADLLTSFEPLEDEKEEHGKVQKDFFEWLGRVRHDTMGKTPHYFLHLLVTHLDNHRRGAGGMLLRWGTERADRANLPIFLEATEMGRPLYKRHGFEDIETTMWDLVQYGSQGVVGYTTMIRQPLKVE